MKEGTTMKRIPVAALVAALLASPALAQAQPAPPEDDPPVVFPTFHLAVAEVARAQAEAWQRWSEDFTRDMRISMGTLFSGRMESGKIVKGAPYSAEVITEMNQPLADGNVISKKTSGRVYRDGEGRSRQESGAPGETSVYINDPVAGHYVVLNPAAKRAIVKGAGHFENHSAQAVRVDGTEEVRVEDGKVFLNGKEVAGGALVIKAKSGKEVKVENGKLTVDGKEVGGGDGTGSHVYVKREVVDGVPREEVRVKVVRMGDDSPPPQPPIPPVPPVPPEPHGALRPPVPPVPPMPPLPPMPGLDSFHFESTAGLGKGVTTSLGTKDFDGVKAEGTSTVWTIAAGRIGNRNPINVTKESWYAHDLQVLVYARHSDPRTGESIYRLASIKRAEPAAELFKVPEDYTVKGREGRATKPPNPPG
jgi:hypothetical protein